MLANGAPIGVPETITQSLGSRSRTMTRTCSPPLETSVAAVTFAIGSAGWATGATIAELVTFVRS